MEPATQVQGSGGDNGGGVIVGMQMPPDPEWSKDVVEIGDSIANLTLVQAVQLSEYLEEVHGIKASGGVPQYQEQLPREVPKDQVPEQTEFSLIYDGYEPDKKINLVKVYREVTSMGLKEAMDFITNGTGKPIKEGMAHGEACILRDKLIAAGAKCTLK